ncbi:hypothetical protein SISNIDRAFT_457006 [Sistotremastrum niveocremeum HHB9708]|uniref:WW domain-containing protein n=1 Tax=Sistotremastrum niveocremeum HHB9708 TaxID=1314777 RepID=A0A164S064_9AGAM|nr:hypothetical protein SISNIDRAFT_457006 [Sistotremastrum niveocremeum HHB9708]
MDSHSFIRPSSESHSHSFSAVRTNTHTRSLSKYVGRGPMEYGQSQLYYSLGLIPRPSPSWTWTWTSLILSLIFILSLYATYTYTYSRRRKTRRRAIIKPKPLELRRPTIFPTPKPFHPPLRTPAVALGTFYADPTTRHSPSHPPSHARRHSSASSSNGSFHTTLSTINLPMLAAQMASVLGPLPPHWEMRLSSDNRVFFVDYESGQSTWRDPRLTLPDSPPPAALPSPPQTPSLPSPYSPPHPSPRRDGGGGGGALGLMINPADLNRNPLSQMDSTYKRVQSWAQSQASLNLTQTHTHSPPNLSLKPDQVAHTNVTKVRAHEARLHTLRSRVRASRAQKGMQWLPLSLSLGLSSPQAVGIFRRGGGGESSAETV